MENENYIPEKQLYNHPTSLSKDQNSIIMKYMEKCVCKIILENGDKGTGTLCKITIPNKEDSLPVLITNNHVLNDRDIDFNKTIILTLNDDKEKYKIKIGKDRKTFTMDRPYDITIIEIKKYDGLEINSFLEVDTNIYNDDLKKTYNQKTIVLIQYPSGERVKYSIGVIKDINEINIQNYCDSKPGSSGGPLINTKNFKVLGIHKGGNEKKEYNLGTLLKEPIEKFRDNYVKENLNKINKYYNNKEVIDEIIIEYNLEKGFLNKLLSKKIRILGDKFVENNNKNCEIISNGKRYELCSMFNNSRFNFSQDRLIIKLIGLKEVTNMSSMFEGCDALISLSDLSNLGLEKVKNMSKMFCGCSSLTSLKGLSNWNTINIEDMSEMFKGCSSLQYLSGIEKWNTENVINMQEMFCGCTFQSLPDISIWNTKKVKNMSSIFLNCSKLYYLPDLSEWNFDYNQKYEHYFRGCESLDTPPEPFVLIDFIKYNENETRRKRDYVMMHMFR